MMKTMQYSFIVMLLGLSVFTGGLQAAEKGNSKKDVPAVKKEKKGSEEVKEEITDYSKGFAKFYKFGLPDVKNAKYIKLNMYSSALPSNDYFRYQAKVEGNAWLISENKKSSKAKIVLNQGAVATVYDQQKLAEEMAEKQRKKIEKSKKKNNTITINFRNLTDGKLAGQWNKANLKKDADKITKHIEKEMKKEHFWGKNSLGIWFLFAIHLNQKGLKKEANKLAGVLFEAGKGKRIVILQALNALADAQYGVVYAQFKADHNWKKYSANVAKIYNLYKKGWKKAEGVKKLADLLAKRLDKSSSLEVKGITKEEQKLLQELIDKSTTTIRSGLWVLKDKLKPKESDDSEVDSNEEESEAIAKIQDKGMKALPFLIKLLGNQTLILADKDDIQMNSMFSGHTFFHSYSSDISGGDRVFKQMKRPMTLGELAKKILDPIIIQEGESDTHFNQMMLDPTKDDDDDFCEICESWYKENKDKSPIELARLYIKDGNKNQKANAVSYLLNNNEKDEYPVIEKYLLDEETRDKHNNRFRDKLAIRYAGKRGVAAKEFAEKYIAIIDPDGEVQKADKEAKKSSTKKTTKKKTSDSNSTVTEEIFIESDSGNGGMSKWKREQILNTIERLRSMTSDESVEDIIDDILGDKREWNSKLNSLIAERLRMSDKGIDNKLAVILKGAEAAAKKKQSKLFTDLMTMAVRCSKNISVPQDVFNFSSREDDIPTKLEKPDPKKNKEIWKSLISNKLPFGEYRNSISKTIGDVSAIYYEVIFGDTTDASLTFYAPILGKKLYAQIKKRAEKRLNGVQEDKLPKLPSISELSEKDRKKKIEAVLKKMRNSQNIKKTVASLSLDERIFLKQGLDKDKKLNKKLSPLANNVIKVVTKMPGSEKFAKFAGKQFSMKMADEIRNFILNALKNKKNAYCRIYRHPSLRGITIFITEIPKKQLPPEIKQQDKDAKKILVASLQVPGAFNSEAYWPLTSENESAKTVDKSEDDDLFGDMEEEIMEESKDFYSKKQKNFNDKVKLFEAGKLNSMLSGGIYFLGGVE